MTRTIWRLYQVSWWNQSFEFLNFKQRPPHSLFKVLWAIYKFSHENQFFSSAASQKSGLLAAWVTAFSWTGTTFENLNEYYITPKTSMKSMELVLSASIFLKMSLTSFLVYIVELPFWESKSSILSSSSLSIVCKQKNESNL